MAETVKVLGVRVDVGQARQRLGELTNAMGVLKNQKAKLDKQMRTGKELTRAQQMEYAKLQGQILKTKVETKKYTNALAIQNGTMAKTSGFVMGIRKALTGMAGQFLGVMAAFMLVKNVIGIFAKFEQANADLAAVLGKTRGEISGLTEDAKKYGSVTKFTATEVSGLQKEFAKLGFSVKEIKNATKATLNLAAATNTDLARAAEVAGSTVRAFGLDAKDTQRVTDVMAKSFSSSALDMEKFATSMRAVAPVAKNAGLNIEQTTSMLGVLVDRGVEASTAGTSLRNVFLELSKQGLTFEEAMQKINTSTDKNKTALDLFGKRGAVVGTILAETAGDTALLEGKLNSAGGAAQRMADEQLDTLSGKVTILGSAWEGFILSLEDGDGVFSNLLEGIIETTTGLLSFLAGTDTATDSWREQVALTKQLDDNLTPLVDRYDELEINTKRTEAEQAELEETMKAIAEIVPIAVTEFGEYGEALSISTEAARAFNEESKAVLLIKNKDAIKENTKALKEYEQEHKVLLATLSGTEGGLRDIEKVGKDFFNRVEKGGKNARIELVKFTADELTDLTNLVATAKTNVVGTRALLAELRGEETEASLQRKKEAEEAKAITEEEKNAGKELTDSKTKELDKRQKERDKAAEKQLEGERKNQQLRLELAAEEAAEKTQLIFDQFLKEKEISALKDEARFEKMEADAELRLLEAETLEEERLATIDKENAEFAEKMAAQKLRDGATEAEKKAHLAKIALLEGQHTKKLEEIEEKFEAIKKRNRERSLQSTANLLGAVGGLMKKDSIAKKAFMTGQAIISTYLAANNALATGGPTPFNYIAMAAAIITGLANVAQINNVKFAKGGVLKGKSHARGGIPTMDGQYEFEGGEAVINKRSTAKYGALLSQINQVGGGIPFARGGVTKFQDGGINAPISFPDSETDLISTSEQLTAQMGAIKVVNLVSETTEQQNNILNVTSEAEMG